MKGWDQFDSLCSWHPLAENENYEQCKAILAEREKDLDLTSGDLTAVQRNRRIGQSLSELLFEIPSKLPLHCAVKNISGL